MTSYVIQIVDVNNVTRYVAFDSHSGGYPWYPDGMFSAHQFRTMDEALREFNDMINGKPTHWSDGTFGAPSGLRGAFRLGGDYQGGNVTKNAGWIHIVAISGSRWSEISATLVHGRYIEVEEFINERDKQPIITIKETGGQSVR